MAGVFKTGARPRRAFSNHPCRKEKITAEIEMNGEEFIVWRRREIAAETAHCTGADVGDGYQ